MLILQNSTLAFNIKFIEILLLTIYLLHLEINIIHSTYLYLNITIYNNNYCMKREEMSIMNFRCYMTKLTEIPT